MVPESRIESLRKLYSSYDQEHIFEGLENISSSELDEFIADLESIDIENLMNSFDRATREDSGVIVPSDIQPLDDSEFDSEISCTPEKLKSWYNEGLNRIAANEVATIVMAGGQGTRLGSSRPKGCYKIGIPSDKSLFQIQSERILRLQKIAADHAGVDPSTVRIVSLVMTSLATRSETEEFFRENNYFGLDPSQFKMFDQGKLILQNYGKLSKSPDGNGGIYHGLVSSNLLKELKNDGVKYFHAYSVDNILVRVADPWLIGYSVLRNAESGALTLPKQSWNEKVGVVCKNKGKYQVLEYSEIPEELAKKINPETNSLYYNHANICNHFFHVDFLEKIESFKNELDYHVAKKSIPYFDTSVGKTITPPKGGKTNGIKLERFIFDVFAFCKNLSVLNVDRSVSFSPLKNPPGSGSDCPETSRADLINLHIRYAEAAGAVVEGNARSSFEISPLVSYAGEGLEFLKNRIFVDETIIDKQ
ncbi:UDP-N-acetylhexosamine pyrophosphorylase-like protein 1 [Smittium culicis]|uniref:UDP-N-acetylglucosamine diphosphorylase n=1 Tax=Smittium culicis TaxID=133412 RepID=A0A1R1YFQ7_9FUNG|nr:UDP-N-acetylhexosamine pyrophosphorylase-like protein 1 [Smittium culicis]